MAEDVLRHMINSTYQLQAQYEAAIDAKVVVEGQITSLYGTMNQMDKIPQEFLDRLTDLHRELADAHKKVIECQDRLEHALLLSGQWYKKNEQA